MTFRDLVATSTGNLRRMKLRASLTISGIVIAIAAFVAMLSFGAGMQENVARQFDDLGLFSTMLVYPPRTQEIADTTPAAVLDRRAVDSLSVIPGVTLAYPFDALGVTVAIADTELVTTAQALPVAAAHTRLFSQLVVGATLDSGSTHDALVTDDFLKKIGVTSADSIIGTEMVVSVRLATLDSGLTHVFGDGLTRLKRRFAYLELDSVFETGYLRGQLQEEIEQGMSRFLHGYLNARRVVSDTLTIRGVMEGRPHGRSRIKPIIISAKTAARFTSGGFGGTPTDLFAALGSGSIFSGSAAGDAKVFTRVTLNLDPGMAYGPIRDSVEALGFRTFSYAEEFDEIRRFFFYFDMALGLIGLIALVTAALGIVNTMVMSIIERTREIGVLKSLGADERDIRLLFLVESGAMGVIGAVLGIAFGWLISRAASLVAREIMARNDVPSMELFAMPWWLIATALFFGVFVSLAAGFYPAARAARVDPVQALRSE